MWLQDEDKPEIALFSIMSHHLRKVLVIVDLGTEMGISPNFHGPESWHKQSSPAGKGLRHMNLAFPVNVTLEAAVSIILQS